MRESGHRGHRVIARGHGNLRKWRTAVRSNSRSFTPIRLHVLAAVALIATGTAAQDRDVPALLEHYGCSLCHADREPIAGPSWVEIAAKYQVHPHAATILTEVIKRGKHGTVLWPMPPMPEVTDADAKRIVRYILEQKQ
jgi:cytochrome c